MDAMYNGHFRKWVCDEANFDNNVPIIARIANEGHSVPRVVNALRWLTARWPVRSTALLLRHVTAAWARDCSCAAPLTDGAAAALGAPSTTTKAAVLVHELSALWEPHAVADLVGCLLEEWPCVRQRHLFLATLTNSWDFGRLSFFLIALGDRVHLEHRTKLALLRDSAERDRWLGSHAAQMPPTLPDAPSLSAHPSSASTSIPAGATGSAANEHLSSPLPASHPSASTPCSTSMPDVDLKSIESAQRDSVLDSVVQADQVWWPRNLDIDSPT
ncbi:hypothetical protein HK105_205333 [Polyrhizophydium stewartii]|uniref:Uncharacterized protein n=1 Tax=Polyrhizophydium stewartii TaxID=2732419 RepID=A0ABR4N6X3_9FUNG